MARKRGTKQPDEKKKPIDRYKWGFLEEANYLKKVLFVEYPQHPRNVLVSSLEELRDGYILGLKRRVVGFTNDEKYDLIRLAHKYCAEAQTS